MVIYFIFLLDIKIKGRGQFESVHVYTIIAYINLIIGPLSSIPNTIIYMVQAVVSCRRIDHLMKAEDRLVLKSSGFEPGQIAIRDFVGTWSSYNL